MAKMILNTVYSVTLPIHEKVTFRGMEHIILACIVRMAIQYCMIDCHHSNAPIQACPSEHPALEEMLEIGRVELVTCIRR